MMVTVARRFGLLLSLTALLAVGVSQQAYAAYTKLYRFYNQTGATQGYVRATTVGLEIIPTQYASPTAWAPGTTGQVVVTGVPSSTVTFGIRGGVSSGVTVANGAMATAGWTTSDSTCRLRDLRWVTAAGVAGAAVSPTQTEGVQGGGYLTRDEAGQLVWVITNDTGLPLDLSTAEFDVIYAPPVLPGAVSTAASSGGDPSVVAVRLHELNAGLSGLCSAITQARKAGRIDAATASSLTAPLSLAARFTPVALRAYTGGKLTAALANWADAAAKVQLFLDKLAQLQAAGKVPADLFSPWSATGAEVRDGLLALPGDEEAEDPATFPPPDDPPPPPPPPAPSDPADPPEPPLTYAPWPLDGGTLLASQYTAFVVPSLDLQSARGEVTTAGPGDVATLVLRGMHTQGGQILLEWEEQVTVTDDLEPPEPQLTPAPDYYDASGVGHYRADPGMVRLSSPAADVARVYWGFLDGDEGEEFDLMSGAPGAELAMQPPKRLLYCAQDTTGNLSRTEAAVVDPWPADELRVDASWTEGNCGGGQWGVTAFNSIQSAIDAAQNGYTVLVSSGTYHERINFLGKAITVRSSEPGDPEVVGTTIIDGGAAGSVVSFVSGEGAASVLTGFVITNGGVTQGGGGVACDSSSPTITHNIIQGNNANDGGGIGCFTNSNPTISYNTVRGNTATYGGGIYCVNSSPTITNNTIEDNEVVSFFGGGICCYSNASPTIADNAFARNTAQYGGGIFCREASSPAITRNSFEGNTGTSYGGGICLWDSPATIQDCTLSANTSYREGGGIALFRSPATIVQNCAISGNAADYGGGVSVKEGSPTIQGCTLNGNTATGEGGGIGCIANASPNIRNTIIAFSTQGGGISVEAGSTATVTYCDVFGNTGGEYVGMTDPTGDNGNISEDPLFVSVSDLHLQSQTGHWNGSGWVPDSQTSSCIDAGDPQDEYGLEPAPNGWRLNMGAYGGTAQASKSFESGVRIVETGDVFSTIQEGIDFAEPGQTVEVSVGTYVENINFLGKAIVVRSTDPLDPDVVAATVIDGGAVGSVVTFNSGEGSDSVLEGFRITNGRANSGAGINCFGGSPTISLNQIVGNVAPGDWSAGGGICAHGPVAILDNLIQGNTAEVYLGGGIACIAGASPYDVTIQGNRIIGNICPQGGGIGLLANVGGDLSNNLIAQNQASSTGGGLFLSDCTIAITNNTLVGNIGAANGGAVHVANWSAGESISPFSSCIITASTGTGITVFAGSAPSVSYCDVFANSDGEYAGMANPTGQDGNISEDPRFVSASDYHLQASSPCVNTGDPDPSGLPEGDLDGNARFVNVRVDMGAYEYQGLTGVVPAALVLTGAAAVATHGGAQIVFTLSRDADVTVNVLNIAGRPIKQVVADRTYPKGSSTVLWNCFSDRGTKVPSGSYIVQITGRAADGQQVSRICPVRVKR